MNRPPDMGSAAQHRATTGSLVLGVSSAFRINPFTGRALSVRRAHGPYLETTDGRTYLDMFMAHGSTVLGHAHPAVMQAVRDSLDDGVVIGYETGLGELVAERLSAVIPSAEWVRFTASGSEAVASAMRLARAHTGRDIVIKVDGHFNGGSDYAMLNSLWAYSDAANPGGRASRPIPSSGGIPRAISETVVPVPWNDLAALEATLNRYRDRVAAVVMVPIDFNNGCLTAAEGYLAAAGELTRAHGALCVFDEVLSGFKTGMGGAQSLYGVTPDITLLSKAMSSGVPLSAICGRRSFLETLTAPPPRGAVQGGTFAGSIMGLAAARATLALLSEEPFYPEFLGRCERFFQELQQVFDRSPLAARVQWVGCMFSIYVGTRDPVQTYAQLRRLDPDLGRRFFAGCIDEGVYFHTDFSVSAAHTEEVLGEVLTRVAAVASRVGPQAGARG
jgi:glutamate-1-semialdehyde 2,1-aminomutase